MTARLDTGYERLTAAQAAQVDAACDAFEAALAPARCNGDVRPQIEAACQAVEAYVREVLIRELVVSEIGARQEAGESPGVAEYQTRFPYLEPAWLERVIIAASGTAPTKLAGAPSVAPRLSTMR